MISQTRSKSLRLVLQHQTQLTMKG